MIIDDDNNSNHGRSSKMQVSGDTNDGGECLISWESIVLVMLFNTNRIARFGQPIGIFYFKSSCSTLYTVFKFFFSISKTFTILYCLDVNMHFSKPMYVKVNKKTWTDLFTIYVFHMKSFTFRYFFIILRKCPISWWWSLPMAKVYPCLKSGVMLSTSWLASPASSMASGDAVILGCSSLLVRLRG